MQHNYISDKLGNNGKPKRDADPANQGPLPIKNKKQKYMAAV